MPFILKSAGLVLAYLVAAKIGLVFGTVSNSVTIFWPAGGIALAALLLGGVRYLPAVFIGAYLSAVMVKAPLIFGLGSALGNMLETYIGFTLLSRFSKFNPSLNHTRDLFTLIALGALIPAIASATLGPLTLLASGLINTENLPGTMWRWWRADVLGIAFFTPLILLFAHKKPFFPNNPKEYLENLGLWATSIIAGQIVLLGWRPFGITFDHPPQLAWLFILVIWAGLRTERKNTSLLQLMFLIQALTSAYLETGFFADDFVLYGLANFWIFAMLLAIGGMALAIQETAQRQSAHQNEHHANHDFLTSLPNRMLFYDRFTQKLALAKRHDSKFAVFYLDIDKFKQVNDSLGHRLGDQLLIAIAKRLSSLVRETDTVSRLGGDEFAILVSEVSTVEDVTTLANKILNALTEPFILDGQIITVSGSLGVALYDDHGKDMETILHCADAAMYRAKQNGQNTYIIAEPN